MKRPTPSWLSSAIFYEIYPQSFLDTNGDGIGDLAGVISKLDYIQSIGCNAILAQSLFRVAIPGWRGGCARLLQNCAPVWQQRGYEETLRGVPESGIRVCLDLVAGHTSDEHPWFKQSARPEKNKYTNWYVWTDNAWCGPGGNLEGIKGCHQRDGAYVTNFFAFQPARIMALLPSPIRRSPT